MQRGVPGRAGGHPNVGPGGNAVPPTDALKGWLQSYGPLYISMDAGGSDAWGQEFSSYNGSYTFYHPIN